MLPTDSVSRRDFRLLAACRMPPGKDGSSSELESLCFRYFPGEPEPSPASRAPVSEEESQDEPFLEERELEVRPGNKEEVSLALRLMVASVSQIQPLERSISSFERRFLTT